MVHRDDVYSWNVPYPRYPTIFEKSEHFDLSVTIFCYYFDGKLYKIFNFIHFSVSHFFSEQKNSQIRHIAGRLKWTDPLGGIYLIIMNPGGPGGPEEQREGPVTLRGPEQNPDPLTRGVRGIAGPLGGVRGVRGVRRRV